MNIGTNVTGITIPQGAVKNIKRGTEMLWQDGGLPTAFQRCEYIESHGEEYIDTCVSPSTDHGFEVRGFFTGTANGTIIGSGTTGGVGYFGITVGPRNIQVYWGGLRTISKSWITNHIYNFKLNFLNDKKCTVDDKEIASLAQADITTRNVVLFAFSYGSIVQRIAWAFVGAKITNEQQIIRDFIPCYLRTDWNGIPAGTIGLYDLCGSLSTNGTPFYTNEGTGEFTKGADAA